MSQPLYSRREYISEVLKAVTEEELFFLEEGERLGFYQFLIQFRLGQRLYYLNDAMVENEFWYHLRDEANEYLLDVISRISVGFQMGLVGGPGNEGVSYNTYVDHLATVIGSLFGTHTTTKTRHEPDVRIADVEFMDKVPTLNNLRAMLHQNPWLVTLISLERHLTAVIPMRIRRRLMDREDLEYEEATG